MASTYNIPTSSLGKIQRWYNAQKAAGRRVSPYELEAAYRGELGSLAGRQTTNRQITLNEAQAEEARRMNEVNTGLSREQLAAQKEFQLGQLSNQERSLVIQAEAAAAAREAQQAAQEFAKEQARLKKERDDRIDAFEKEKFELLSDERKAQQVQDLASREADRNAAKSGQIASSLTGVGGMAGLSLLLGKDATGASGAARGLDWLGKKITGTPSAPISHLPITDYDFQQMGGAGGGLTQDISYDAWAKDPANANLLGGTYAGGDYGGDLTGLGDFNYDPAVNYGDFGTYDFGGGDFGASMWDYGDLDYSSLMGSGLDWGSDWASGVDWGAIDWSGLF